MFTAIGELTDIGVNWVALFALSVSALIFTGLYYLGKIGFDFSLRTFIGLGAGILLGFVFQGNLEYLSPVGVIYVRIISAVVAPLIVLSIISSVTSLGNAKKITTLGFRSVFWLLINTFIAIIITLAASLLLNIGTNADLNIDSVDAGKLADKNVSFTEVVTNFFPENFISDLLSNNIIPLIIASLALAIAFIRVSDKQKVKPFRDFVEAAKEVVYGVVDIVIEATPYAVLSLTATAVSKASGKAEAIVPLLVLLVVVYALCIFHTYVVNGLLLLFAAKLNPVRFFKKIFSSQLTAFTTQSSVGTLPSTISNLVKKVGVHEEIANFTAPLGTTIGMPGCAGIWPVILAIFAINALGIEYSVQQYIVLAVLALAVSFGTAGVPGTATITATAVFTAAGLPIEVIVLLTPINAIADMARTATNVTAAAVSAAIVARREGRLDDSVFLDTTVYQYSSDSETPSDVEIEKQTAKGGVSQ